jgi:hypothetical protein|tara:strand:+ start:146 stop:550 length:405 start_codon:yes stop_codon:yes gene_type:complete
MLTDCYVAKDPMAILEMLLDATQPISVRVKAAEMIGDIGELEAIEPIRNLKFSNEILKKAVEKGVNKIHDRYFTRECPFCAEMIKKEPKSANTVEKMWLDCSLFFSRDPQQRVPKIKIGTIWWDFSLVFLLIYS